MESIDGADLKPTPNPGLPVDGLAGQSQLDQLYRDHHGLVFSVAYRVTGSPSDAEDVLHTVFLRLLRRKSGVETSDPEVSIDNPEGYLRRAAVNASLDLLRNRREPADADMDRIPSHRPNPEETHVTQHDLAKQLGQAMALLPERWAEVFTLRHIEDRRNPEIAELLGISPLLVGVILHRARRRLQKNLRDMGVRS